MLASATVAGFPR